MKKFFYEHGWVLFMVFVFVVMGWGIHRHDQQAQAAQEYNYLKFPIRFAFDSMTGNGATITAIVQNWVDHSWNSWHTPGNAPTQEEFMFMREVMCAYNEHRESDMDPSWDFLIDKDWVCVH